MTKTIQLSPFEWTTGHTTSKVYSSILHYIINCIADIVSSLLMPLGQNSKERERWVQALENCIRRLHQPVRVVSLIYACQQLQSCRFTGKFIVIDRAERESQIKPTYPWEWRMTLKDVWALKWLNSFLEIRNKMASVFSCQGFLTFCSNWSCHCLRAGEL